MVPCSCCFDLMIIDILLWSCYVYAGLLNNLCIIKSTQEKVLLNFFSMRLYFEILF